TPDGKAVVWIPSLVGRAPVPPQENQTYVHGFPLGCAPVSCVAQIFAAPSAITLPGRTGASAPKTIPGRKWPITCRPATGAGGSALRSEPGGAVTVTGRNEPSLFGTSGQSAHLRA